MVLDRSPLTFTWLSSEDLDTRGRSRSHSNPPAPSTAPFDQPDGFTRSRSESTPPAFSYNEWVLSNAATPSAPQSPLVSGRRKTTTTTTTTTETTEVTETTETSRRTIMRQRSRSNSTPEPCAELLHTAATNAAAAAVIGTPAKKTQQQQFVNRTRARSHSNPSPGGSISNSTSLINQNELAYGNECIIIREEFRDDLDMYGQQYNSHNLAMHHHVLPQGPLEEGQFYVRPRSASQPIPFQTAEQKGKMDIGFLVSNSHQ